MTGWDPYPSYPAGDPGAGGVPGGGVPSGGYLPPQQFGHQPVDPLISPDYSGWWNRGVAIVRRGWQPLAALQAVGVALSLLVQAPAAVFIALSSDELERSFTTSETGTLDVDWTPFVVVMSLTIAAALLAMILTSVVTLACVHVGVSVALGVPPRLGVALRMAVRRLFPLLGWQLLALPVYAVAFCLCFLPIFYVAAVFIVLPVVVAVERTNAFTRCFTLFHRDFGASAGRIATILGLLIAVAVVGGVLGSVVEAALNVSLDGNAGIITGSILSTFLHAVIGGAVAILIAPLTLTAYADMRARTEPLNAMVIAQQLGIAPPANPWPSGQVPQT